MSDYGDEEELRVMESLEAMGKAFGSLDAMFAQMNFYGRSAGFYAAFGAMPLAALAFLTVYLLSDPDSYAAQVCLELSSGFFFFSLAPTVIRLGRKYRWQVPFIGLAIAGPMLWLAYTVTFAFPSLSIQVRSVAQSVLIEYASALLLMVGLEVAMMPWLDRLSALLDEARGALPSSRAA